MGSDTVAVWAERWLATLTTRPSTQARDRSYLANHVLPKFGDREVAGITTWEIQEWVTSLSAYLAPASVQKVHSVLSRLLQAAVHSRALATNPCGGTRLPRIADVEVEVLTPAEVVCLDAAVERLNPNWAEVVPTLADTALRIGEAAALRVNDVDLAAGLVTVRHTLVEVRGHAQLGPPKSRNGRRTIPMLTRATAVRLQQRVDRLNLAGDDFLLGGPTGAPMRPSLFRRRVLRPAAAAEDLSWATPHTLRHTAISMWIACGVSDPFKLTRWAGHRDVSTVYRIYGHLLPEDASGYRTELEALRYGRADGSC